jgi:predicted CXXCH cytochrome family protein
VFVSRTSFLWPLALVLAAASLYAVYSDRPTHLRDTPCASCHLAGRDIDGDNAHKLLASQEVLCAKCHADALKMSHPSGLTPARALPAEYPADWKGDLTCSTCHDPHGAGKGLLRGDKRGKSMCRACHEESFFTRMKDGGVSIALSGHLNATRAELRALDLDPYSLECLGCHANSGDLPQVSIGRNAVLRHASGSSNHPIGRSYRDAATLGGYRPETLLSKNVWLPGGKISCVSCHQGYSKDHGKVISPSRGSGLCFECHDL